MNFLTRSTRGGRARLAALVSIGSKGFSILSTIIMIPLFIKFLGVESYGLWMTLTTIFIYLKLADGGVTIGLIPLTSKADGLDDHLQISKLISSSFFVCLGVTIFILCPLAILFNFLDWGSLFKLDNPVLVEQARKIAIIFTLSIAIGYPAGVARQARAGLQEGAEANTWDFISAILTVIVQLVALFSGFGLVIIAGAAAIIPVVINILHSCVYFAGKGRKYFPKYSLYSKTMFKTLMATGFVFMALTLGQALAIQIDQFLITRMIGLQPVAEYSVVQKIMVQSMLIINLLFIAQFPAYGEALARGDFDWVKKQVTYTLTGTTLVAFASSFSLTFLTQPIVKVWIGDSIMPSTLLVVSIAVYAFIAALSSFFVYFFFAMGLYKRVLWAFVLMVIINIPLTIYLIPHFGAAGAAIATSVGYLLTILFPSLWSFRRILNDLSILQEKILADRKT